MPKEMRFFAESCPQKAYFAKINGNGLTEPTDVVYICAV